MLTSSPVNNAPGIRFEFLNWVASDAMPRDQTQSVLLHEPKFRVSNIDPMSGHDIENASSHPSIVDGNLTIYFESEKTRTAFKDMPLNHPYLHLPFPAADNDDRGG